MRIPKVGEQVTYAAHGDRDNLVTVTVTSTNYMQDHGDIFDGVRVDNGIEVWGRVADIIET